MSKQQQFSASLELSPSSISTDKDLQDLFFSTSPNIGLAVPDSPLIDLDAIVFETDELFQEQPADDDTPNLQLEIDNGQLVFETNELFPEQPADDDTPNLQLEIDNGQSKQQQQDSMYSDELSKIPKRRRISGINKSNKKVCNSLRIEDEEILHMNWVTSVQEKQVTDRIPLDISKCVPIQNNNVTNELNTAAGDQVQKNITEENPMGLIIRLQGCGCSKSRCRKSYCQCYKAGQKCGVHCNCTGCQNTEQGLKIKDAADKKKKLEFSIKNGEYIKGFNGGSGVAPLDTLYNPHIVPMIINQNNSPSTSTQPPSFKVSTFPPSPLSIDSAQTGPIVILPQEVAQQGQQNGNLIQGYLQKSDSNIFSFFSATPEQVHRVQVGGQRKQVGVLKQQQYTDSIMDTTVNEQTANQFDNQIHARNPKQQSYQFATPKLVGGVKHVFVTDHIYGYNKYPPIFTPELTPLGQDGLSPAYPPRQYQNVIIQDKTPLLQQLNSAATTQSIEFRDSQCRGQSVMQNEIKNQFTDKNQNQQQQYYQQFQNDHQQYLINQICSSNDLNPFYDVSGTNSQMQTNNSNIINIRNQNNINIISNNTDYCDPVYQQNVQLDENEKQFITDFDTEQFSMANILFDEILNENIGNEQQY